MSMIRKIRLAGALFSLLAILVTASIAGAQTSNGTLVGAVTDQTGAVIPNVEVKVVSPQYGQEHEATTDSVGNLSHRRATAWDLFGNVYRSRSGCSASRKRHD